jgi:kinesin family protein 18/19
METDSSRIRSSASNVLVAIRVRPLLPNEKAQNAKQIVKVLDSKLVILLDPGNTASDDFLRLNKSREKRWAFDLAFDESADQRTVYEQATKGIIDGVCQGINACVFTYGATGAGKTFTMLGNHSEPGIMSLTLHELFTKLNSIREQNEFKIKCSFVEVYNENIRDLLGEGKDLELREDPVKGMCVAGVSEVSGLERVEDIMNLLDRGNRNRTTEPTSANITSSRSHAVLQVVVEVSEKGQGPSASIQVGKLSLIDLAGSERASVTNNKGIRLLECANINRSLLALGNCITALADNASGRRGVFVPYRDSKLTRLLKDSLGGNGRTVMIANVSPCHINYEDTRNSLKYASRARNIQTELCVNRTTVNQHISNYKEIICELKSVVYDLKGKLLAAEKTSEHVLEASEQWRQELMENLDERVRLKKSLIDIKTEIGNIGLSFVNFTPRVRTPGNSLVDEDDDDDDQEGSPAIKRLSDLRIRKQSIEERIEANDAAMLSLQAELPNRVKDEDVCGFLSLLYRNQVLEIEGMDKADQIEWMTRSHEKTVRLKDKEIEVLREQVRVRDEIMRRLTDHVDDGSSISEVRNQLIDVESLMIEAPEVPSSPLPAITSTFSNSPRASIPLSNRIKGITESILQSAVKNSSPRGAPPSTAESGRRGDRLVESTPRKPKASRKILKVVIPPLPQLSVQGSNTHPQISSTRRSRTENPPGSKEGRRMIQARNAIKSNMRR